MSLITTLLNKIGNFMKLEVKVQNVYICDNKKVIEILERWEKDMPESPEVTVFREAVSAGLDNIAADIQRLVDKPTTGLSEEDKVSLQAIVDRVGEVAAVVPEE